MLQWTVDFALQHNLLIYLLIIVLAFFQGPLLAVIFGIILRLGYLHVLPIYVALMVGDLVGDTIWYHVGRLYGHRFVGRFGKYFGVTDHNIGIVTELFHRYKNYVLFLSKISNGFGFAIVILLTAGMVKIPFKMYLSSISLDSSSGPAHSSRRATTSARLISRSTTGMAASPSSPAASSSS